jgi:hypothetical protein
MRQAPPWFAVALQYEVLNDKRRRDGTLTLPKQVVPRLAYRLLAAFILKSSVRMPACNFATGSAAACDVRSKSLTARQDCDISAVRAGMAAALLLVS